jgi:hypothetical protein
MNREWRHDGYVISTGAWTGNHPRLVEELVLGSRRSRSAAAGRHDFVTGGPEIEVLLLYRGGHHAG